MTFAQIMAALAPFAAVVEPVLVQLEQNSLIPELTALANAATTSPDMKLLLNGLVTFAGNFIVTETQKL